MLLSGPRAQQVGVRVRVRRDLWDEVRVEQRSAAVVEDGLVAFDLVLALFVLGGFDCR